MMIVLGFYRRRPDLSWDEFSRHWRDVHGPLVRDTPEVATHVRRYVQHHLRPSTRQRAGSGFDGFSEVWYDDVEAMNAIARGPGFAILLADEERFLDLSESRVVTVDQQVVVLGEHVRLV